jgi:IclR helix-turn-helix domain
MITHVPGPFERLKERLAYRFSTWLDTLCADQPEPKVGGVPAAAPLPPTKGLPAVLRALEQGADGSVRRLARDLGSSKSTVHRAKRKMLAYA